MTDTLVDDIPTHQLSSEDVAEWLKENPGFFKQHPEILEILALPSVEDGGKGRRRVADFQTYMIKRLQEDKQNVLDAKQQIVETSRANMNNQERIQTAVIHLLDARSLDDLLQTITMDLASLLGVDISSVVVESNGHEIPHIHVTGIRVVPGGTIENWMQNHPVLIESDICGIEAIYGGGCQLVKSQILIRLQISHDTPPALIAFGSRDPTLFHDGLGTNQIQFLSSVIERCLRTHLSMP